MKRYMPLESPGGCGKSVKYVEIRLKSTAKPLYACDRLIAYGEGLSPDRVESVLRKRLKGVRL